MDSTITIATGSDNRRQRLEPTSAPVYLTPAVLADIARTVGHFPPETGGMLFGPAGSGGSDVFEFDEAGSRAASAAVYRPDVEWANARQDHHISHKPMRLFDGFVHSHPAAFNHPSSAAGGANGDMGYAAAALEANDHLDRFLLFIATRQPRRAPVLWPWIVERSEPTTPKFAPVIVCEPSHFPPRRFPAEHAARFGVETPGQTPVIGLCLDHVAEVARTAVYADRRVLKAVIDGLAIEVHLPPEFPQQAPMLVVETPNGRLVAPVRWRARSNLAVEIRLGHLVRHARLFAQEV